MPVTPHQQRAADVPLGRRGEYGTRRAGPHGTAAQNGGDACPKHPRWRARWVTLL
jgi:hypothetical protein